MLASVTQRCPLRMIFPPNWGRRVPNRGDISWCWFDVSWWNRWRLVNPRFRFLVELEEERASFTECGSHHGSDFSRWEFRRRMTCLEGQNPLVRMQSTFVIIFKYGFRKVLKCLSEFQQGNSIPDPWAGCRIRSHLLIQENLLTLFQFLWSIRMWLVGGVGVPIWGSCIGGGFFSLRDYIATGGPLGAGFWFGFALPFLDKRDFGDFRFVVRTWFGLFVYEIRLRYFEQKANEARLQKCSKDSSECYRGGSSLQYNLTEF